MSEAKRLVLLAGRLSLLSRARRLVLLPPRPPAPRPRAPGPGPRYLSEAERLALLATRVLAREPWARIKHTPIAKRLVLLAVRWPKELGRLVLPSRVWWLVLPRPRARAPAGAWEHGAAAWPGCQARPGSAKQLLGPRVGGG